MIRIHWVADFYFILKIFKICQLKLIYGKESGFSMALKIHGKIKLRVNFVVSITKFMISSYS